MLRGVRKRVSGGSVHLKQGSKYRSLLAGETYDSTCSPKYDDIKHEDDDDIDDFRMMMIRMILKRMINVMVSSSIQ